MEPKQDLKILRHSAAHLLAQAVLELFPDTKLTIGPATEDGFFYDFAPSKNFKEEDLIKIEAKMHELSEKNYPVLHEEISKDKAFEIYKDNPFKLELIYGIEGDTVGLSKQGNFYDLCRGGHVKSTGEIKYFKLLSVAGSYWRADRTKANLQRIYGTAFFTKEDLEKFELQKEEALKYDHRKLGKEMDLFSFHDEGPGFPFFHPKGKAIINVLIEYMRRLRNLSGYVEIATPIILSDELWKSSGHYAHYKENMYFTEIDEKSYAIKPMNCPGAILVYKTRPRSYRELPLRLSEFGLVHRHELSGVLHGLLRVRAFTQDDSHVFCTVDQIQQEVSKKVENTFKVLNKFGFDKVKVKLSTKPEKAMGDDALWIKAIDYLKTTLENLHVNYEIEHGDGAFYGPKIDFKIEDSMGREWQLSTIQVDFFQPINFDLHYVAPSGQNERPVMIHQAIYGSLERFLAILLEHFKGNLPFFIAPIQIKILTITDEQKEYANQILKILKENNIRAEMDESSDPISGKIKSATLDKIPWMLVIGKKEVENNTITLRFRDGKQENNLSIKELIDRCKSEDK